MSCQELSSPEVYWAIFSKGRKFEKLARKRIAGTGENVLWADRELASVPLEVRAAKQGYPSHLSGSHGSLSVSI
jgi:hypothetical protein